MAGDKVAMHDDYSAYYHNTVTTYTHELYDAILSINYSTICNMPHC